jgi:class 3 adenylate cyclase
MDLHPFSLSYSTSAGSFNSDSLYVDYPVIGHIIHYTGSPDASDWSSLSSTNLQREIAFSGKRERYCICFIDMMNSTQIAARLTDIELSKYYSIFLNAMAVIVKNFDGTIVKNAGDALIFYFQKTADTANIGAFKDVLDCAQTMIAAHHPINAKMFAEKLPILNYRISAVYGRAEIAKATSSASTDLFGSSMNLCAKINSKAPSNRLVVGDDLYQLVKETSISTEYDFEKIGEYEIGDNNRYQVMLVSSKSKYTILNPFDRRSLSGDEPKR